MLNYIWGFMIVIGMIVAAFNGKMEAVSTESINSAKEAVTLCITMLGVMSLWMGLMNVARQCGIIQALTKGLSPIIRLLFPALPKDHIVNEYIASNMISNVLGLGWAATPMGLKAMQELAKLNDAENIKKGLASIDMCTFLIINISSLQLIPVNMIAYRSQYGSVNPSAIIATALIATCCSTAAGIVFSVVMRKIKKV